jgi:hypothetical protein
MSIVHEHDYVRKILAQFILKLSTVVEALNYYFLIY